MSNLINWILVVGYGSIGRRHYQNLVSLGYEDVRLLRTVPSRKGAFESPAEVRIYRDLNVALADGPAVVIVCNPTALHVETAVAALQAGANVLLEKPVAVDLAAAESLLEIVRGVDAACSIAYCFRYHPLYKALHDIVASGRIGRPFHAHTCQASFLPAWHPWEDYHQSYAVQPEQGGVVRTLDHDLDIVRWTLGQPRDVLASAAALSGIGVAVEDTADMIFRFADRLQAHVHVSFARQDYARGMWVVGEEGSVQLDWNQAVLKVHKGSELDEEIRLPDDFELNAIYVDMLRDALAGFGASPPRAAVPLSDGVAALAMAVGALQSSAEGRAVDLKGTD